MTYQYRDPLRLVCDQCGALSEWFIEQGALPVIEGNKRPPEWITSYQKLERHDFCGMPCLEKFEKRFYSEHN